GNDLEGQAVQSGTATPVLRVRGEPDLVRRPTNELERPGAGRMIADLAAVTGQGLGADNWSEEEQRRLAYFQGDPKRVVVRSGDVLDEPDEDLLADVRRARRVELTPRQEVPLEVQLRGVGIEWRVIVEHDALAQMKCIGETIGAHVPGFGQRRLDRA